MASGIQLNSSPQTCLDGNSSQPLEASRSADASSVGFGTVLGKKMYSRGKVNLEFKLPTCECPEGAAQGLIIGVVKSDFRPQGGKTFLANGWGVVAATGNKARSEETKEYLDPFSSGSTIVIHLDFEAKTIAFSINGVRGAPAYNDLEGSVVAAVSSEIECKVLITKQKHIVSKKKGNPCQNPNASIQASSLFLSHFLPQILTLSLT